MELDVAVKHINEITSHPNADRLDLARIGGYEVVVQKGIHQAGDEIIYIPENSLLPQWLLRKINLEGKLSGKGKNRVKPIRLRGELSQGIVLPLRNDTYFEGYDGKEYNVKKINDLASFLGIEKYVAPIPVEMSGSVMQCPINLPHYDVDDWKKDPETLADGKEMICQEKLHGTMTLVAWITDIDADDDEDVGPWIASKGISHRNQCFKHGDDTKNVLYVRTTRHLAESMKNGALEALQENDEFTNQNPYAIAWIGETIGKKVQDLDYGYMTPIFVAFELMVKWQQWSEWKRLSVDMMMDAADRADVPFVPVVGKVVVKPDFDRETIREIQDFAEGASMFSKNEQIREGVVMRHPDGMVRKAVSERYLVRKGGTERN